ncbi:MAG: metallophosphoesterase [Planctomycetota bacterium]|nr:metallophosphoesterase [Planctomycetota bacterium]
MRILEFDPQPFHTLQFLRAARGEAPRVSDLPFHRASVDLLPAPLEALIATSDLQGREEDLDRAGGPRLLGEALAEELFRLNAEGLLPDASATGVILAGDLYARPARENRLGGSGDVRPVWEGFSQASRWVAGVPGNHDVFGDAWSEPALREFQGRPGVALLDQDVVEFDGLRIGGLSGIIGNPRKPWRHSEPSYLRALDELARRRLDLLVLHDGPDAPPNPGEGLPAARTVLESCRPMLVIRGHKFWKEPVGTLSNGTQVLNVDSRVVVISGKFPDLDPS